jgi:hypothetical protein
MAQDGAVEAAVEAIVAETPFSMNELAGSALKAGHMIGGANPLESATPAPWVK